MAEEQLTRARVGARLAFSAGITVLSAVYLWSATRLEVGTLDSPGPGIYPVLVGGGALLVGLWATASGARALHTARRSTAPESSTSDPEERVRTRRAVRFAVIAFCYPALMAVVGFIAASAVFLVVSARLFAERPGWRLWLLFIAVGIAVPWGFAAIFDSLFEIEFPVGVLWD